MDRLKTIITSECVNNDNKLFAYQSLIVIYKFLGINEVKKRDAKLKVIMTLCVRNNLSSYETLFKSLSINVKAMQI